MDRRWQEFTQMLRGRGTCGGKDGGNMGWLATFLQIGSVHPMNSHALEVREGFQKALQATCVI